MIGDVRMITMSCCRSAKGQVFVMDLRLLWLRRDVIQMSSSLDPPTIRPPLVVTTTPPEYRENTFLSTLPSL